LLAGFIFLFVVWSLVVFHWPAAEEGSAGKPTTTSASSSSRQQERVSEQDRRVLEALLLFLRTHNIWGDPRAETNSLQIILAPTTCGCPNFPDAVSARKITADLWADWRRRNTMSVSLRDVRFGDKLIRVQDTSQVAGSEWGIAFRKAYPEALGSYEVTLPGYSRDGQRALVGFQEMLPGAEYAVENGGLYLLVKKKGRWRVAQRYVLTGE
jgi:hypothetical protein